MIIRKPQDKDFPFLHRLWMDAFDEGREEVEHFYATAFSPQRCLVTQEGGIVAGLYWMNAFCGERKLAYIYAFAVEKACRGKGVGKQLLRRALEVLREEGYAGAVLVPGEESLQTYYEKLGFRVFGSAFPTVPKEPGLPAKEVPLKEYLCRRQKLHAALQWEESAFVYLAGFNRLCAAEDWVMALGQEGVQEFIGDPAKLPHILYTLNIVSGKKPPVAMVHPFESICLPETFGPMF